MAVAAIKAHGDWRDAIEPADEVTVTPDLVEALRNARPDVAKDFIENCRCRQRTSLACLVDRTWKPPPPGEFGSIQDEDEEAYVQICAMISKVAAPTAAGVHRFEPHTVACVCAEAIRAGHDLPDHLLRLLRSPRLTDRYQTIMIAVAEADYPVFARHAFMFRIMDLEDQSRVPFAFDSATAHLAAACLEARRPERGAKACRGLLEERRFLLNPYIDLSTETEERLAGELFASVLLAISSDNDLGEAIDRFVAASGFPLAIDPECIHRELAPAAANWLSSVSV